MHVDICSTCAHMDPQNFVCTKHLKNIHDIESCDLGRSEKNEKKIRVVAMIRNVRSVLPEQSTDSMYEAGFASGWRAACGAILASLGVDPRE